MRKFSFNLQRVLDYRQTVEDALLAELAAIRAEYTREKARLFEMMRTRDAFSHRLRKGLSSCDPEQIKQAHSYLQDLSKQVAVQNDKVKRIAEQRDKKTSEVIEAARERKALDRLREQKAEEHRKEAQRRDQEFLDDVGCIRQRSRKCDAGGIAA